MALGMALSTPVAAMAMDSSNTQNGSSLSWLFWWVPSQKSARTVVSQSEPYLIKEDDVIKSVRKTTYSDGSEEITETKSNGLMELGSDMYLMKDGRVDTGTSGTKTYNRGTYSLNKGKVTGVKFAVPKSSQMPNYPTGCEASSMNSFLKWYGFDVSLSNCINAIPREDVVTRNGKRYGPNINEKFAGNPRHGYTSSSPGYGAFSPVITKSLNKLINQKGGGYTAKKITGTKVSGLYKYLREGHPIIVWCTYNMKQPTAKNSWYYQGKDGNWHYFEYPRGTHVVVLRGYDANNVYIMDSYNGSYKTFARSTFNKRYQLLGYQSIILEKND